MSRESFREAIFSLAVYLSQRELSDQGKRLILHYFNQSFAGSSDLKAIDAVETYLGIKINLDHVTSPILSRLLNELYQEAAAWDAGD